MSYANLNDQLDMFGADPSQEYEGVVVSIDDPLQLGRVQVAVPELYDPELGDVPWVGVNRYSPFGIGVNFGVYGSPAVGSNVKVRLQGGDPNYPMIVSCRQVKINSNFGAADWGFEDPNGHLFKVSGDRVTFTSSQGVVIDINGQKLKITTPSDAEFDVGGALIAHVTGGATVTAATVDVTSSGDANITVGGNSKIQSSGILRLLGSMIRFN